MAVIDTLEILIEADSRGLDTQLRKAATTVTSFVDKINGEQVNWQKVLAGALDTAIISGIASSFALAISQAVSFQDTLLNVSNNTGSAIGGLAGSMSSSIIGLTGQTGASLSDTTAAYEAFYKQFGDAATAQTLTAEAGKLALASNQSLADLMPMLIALFNNWGISSLPAAQEALTGLVNAAGQGKFTLNELVNTISGQGALLQGKTNISDLAINMQALSTQTNLTKDTIVTGFAAIAQGVSNPLSNMSLLVRGVKTDISGPDGLIKAFADVSTTIKRFGAAGITMGQQLGLSTEQAVNFGAQTKASFTAAAAAADKIRANLSPLDTVLAANISSIDKFRQAWSQLLATLTKSVGIPVLDTLTNSFEELNKLMAGNFGDIGNAIKHPVDFLTSVRQNLGLPRMPANAPGFLGAGNNPGSNSQPNSMGPVTLNITNNIAPGTGAGSSHQILGQSIGDKAYNAFMGLLASL